MMERARAGTEDVVLFLFGKKERRGRLRNSAAPVFVYILRSDTRDICALNSF